MSLTKRNIEQFNSGYDGMDDEYFYRKAQEAEYREMTNEIPYLERLRIEDAKLKQAIEASARAATGSNDKASQLH